MGSGSVPGQTLLPESFSENKLRICGTNCLLNWPGCICKFCKPQHVVQLIGVHCMRQSMTNYFVFLFLPSNDHHPMMVVVGDCNWSWNWIRLKVLNLFQWISLPLSHWLTDWVCCQLGICTLKIWKFRLFSFFIPKRKLLNCSSPVPTTWSGLKHFTVLSGWSPTWIALQRREIITTATAILVTSPYNFSAQNIIQRRNKRVLWTNIRRWNFVKPVHRCSDFIPAGHRFVDLNRIHLLFVFLATFAYFSPFSGGILAERESPPPTSSP